MTYALNTLTLCLIPINDHKAAFASVQKYVQVHEHAILQICPKTHCIGKTTQNEIQGCTALLHTDTLGDVSVPQKAVTHTILYTHSPYTHKLARRGP